MAMVYGATSMVTASITGWSRCASLSRRCPDSHSFIRLYFLTNFFGGGPWARVLHPFFGVAMMLLFIGMFLRF